MAKETQVAYIRSVPSVFRDNDLPPDWDVVWIAADWGVVRQGVGPSEESSPFHMSTYQATVPAFQDGAPGNLDLINSDFNFYYGSKGVIGIVFLSASGAAWGQGGWSVERLDNELVFRAPEVSGDSIVFPQQHDSDTIDGVVLKLLVLHTEA